MKETEKERVGRGMGGEGGTLEKWEVERVLYLTLPPPIKSCLHYNLDSRMKLISGSSIS